MGPRSRAMAFAGLLSIFPMTLYSPAKAQEYASVEAVMLAGLEQAYASYLPAVADRFITAVQAPMAHMHGKSSTLVVIQYGDGTTEARGRHYVEVKHRRKELDAQLTTTMEDHTFTATIASSDDPPFFARPSVNSLKIEVAHGPYRYRQNYLLDDLLQGRKRTFGDLIDGRVECADPVMIGKQHICTAPGELQQYELPLRELALRLLDMSSLHER